MLLRSLDALDLKKLVEARLRRKLEQARFAFEKGWEALGIRKLERFIRVVRRLSSDHPRPHWARHLRIPPEDAEELEAEALAIIDCL